MTEESAQESEGLGFRGHEVGRLFLAKRECIRGFGIGAPSASTVVWGSLMARVKLKQAQGGRHVADGEVALDTAHDACTGLDPRTKA